VHENCYLTLTDRQRYTLTIDSLKNATTFCMFFERGFVEDVLRATTMPAAGLLDAPQPARPLSVQFAEKLEPGDDRVMAMVRDLNARIGSGTMMRIEWDERFLHIGPSLIWEHQNAAAVVAKIAGRARRNAERTLPAAAPRAGFSAVVARRARSSEGSRPRSVPFARPLSPRLPPASSTPCNTR
jgi:hypothetical protein